MGRALVSTMKSHIWTCCRDNCTSTGFQDWMRHWLCALGRSECILCLGRRLDGYLVTSSMVSESPLNSVLGSWNPLLGIW